MSAPTPSLRLLAGFFITLLAGCDTTSTRIQERAATFAALAPAQQEAIRRGAVDLGYTLEMTYLALGKPNVIEASADGRETVWTYMNYNTPGGAFMLQNKQAVSFDPFGSKSSAMLSGTPTAGRNESGSRTHLSSLAEEGQADNQDGGLGWRQVTGKTGLDRGEVGIPDNMVRQKTAEEMIQFNERQDLLITFYDGKIIAFQLERI